MTDHELLELAAKAAGINNLQWESDGTIQNRMNRPTIPYANHGMMTAIDWNPLADDGDALRLAVKKSVFTDANRHAIFLRFLAEELAKDLRPSVATRRAIVRAAAEIGRTK